MNASKIVEVLSTAHNEDIFYDYREFGDDDGFYENRIDEVTSSMFEAAELIRYVQDIVRAPVVDVDRLRELLA